MMQTLIQRVQYPVGQGGFHSCNINTEDNTNPGSASVFDYVYDCGTYSLAPDGASRSAMVVVSENSGSR